jgi:DNA topoisomerase-1
VDFTAGVEDKLDEIAEGGRQWVEVLQEFYDPFQTALQTAEETMERVRPEPKVTDEVCPNCGKPMLLRSGRYGEFLGCSGYPECKTIVNPKRQELGVPCPVPGCTGQLAEKRSRRGKVFYGCNRYPECSFAAWDKPTDEKCETCGYPKGERVFRGRKLGLRCLNKECPTNATNGKSEEGLPSVTDVRPTRAAAKTTRGKSTTRAKATTAKAATPKATASKSKTTATKTKTTTAKATATKTKAASAKSTTAKKTASKGAAAKKNGA